VNYKGALRTLLGTLVPRVRDHFGSDAVSRSFGACLHDTVHRTIRMLDDGTIFVLTGDIPAMWLRDSTAQVRPYLSLCSESSELQDLIERVIARQVQYINLDAYANAFNPSPSGAGHHGDLTEMSPWVWERKYEVDSLCYPLQLSYLFWRATNRTDHFTQEWQQAVSTVLELWTTEQAHPERSQYRFQRLDGPPSDTLACDGLGTPVAVTGMTWSGFRPSDDACTYGYLVPANMFAAVTLGQVAEIAREVLDNDVLGNRATQLGTAITDGIARFALHEDPVFGPIYAYEVDGLGQTSFMDDANVPNLLSMPYIGFCDANDAVYRNTRAFVLSKSNPHFYSGTYASGLGSRHTAAGWVWHLGMAMAALTSEDRAFKAQTVLAMCATAGGSLLMHESFDPNEPGRFTRDWFSWANAMFCELVLDCIGTLP